MEPPNTPNTIYDYGFDVFLQRTSEEEIVKVLFDSSVENPLVYNQIKERLSLLVPGQQKLGSSIPGLPTIDSEIFNLR